MVIAYKTQQLRNLIAGRIIFGYGNPWQFAND